jgi:hypothetical protein
VQINKEPFAMKPANIAEIERLLADYHGSYVTQYAFFDGARGEFGDHEEALLLNGRTDDLPGSPPEAIDARAFYGPLYYWGKNMLVSVGAKTTKRPVPYYYETTGKPYAREDVLAYEAELAQVGVDYHELARAFSHNEDGDRWGYCLMFLHNVYGERKINTYDAFRRIEAFMTDDVRNCTIYDWRADLGSHCTDEDRAGCWGCYLWTVFCPSKKRLTVVYWHFNYVYA